MRKMVERNCVSWFKGLKKVPAVEQFQLNNKYQSDEFKDKVNLSIGGNDCFIIFIIRWGGGAL